MKTNRRWGLLAVAPIFLSLAMLSPDSYAQTSQDVGVTERIRTFLSSDFYRFAIGGSNMTLNNPVGFDVSSSTHDNGRPDSDFFSLGTFSWTLTGENSLGGAGLRKWLWSVHYDSEDFEGLELQTLMLGGGWAIDPASSYAFGARLAGGLGTGITRSSTFFDSAAHLSLEAWVSIGVQLGRFTIDATLRERKALNSTLDERKASPATQTRTIAIGWVF